MALIPVKIQYKNKEEIVEFEDSLSFGQTEKLINDSVDLSDVSKPKIDLALYRMNLLVMTIKTAPFKTGDITTLNMLNGKLVRGILKEIVKSHPLTTYIEDCWDKEQVDRQPTDYLKKLFSTHTEVMAENEKNQSIPLSKNFK